jgi:4'-phosphopantetheinyl transferase
MVEFLRTDKGKPYLPRCDIHFNLSHSGDWALLAVAKAELIGVDVEAVSTARDLIGIAENYYHPHEFAQLQMLAGAAQNDLFYRLWTLKEAFLKATGTGISAGLEKIAFDLADNKITAQIAPALGEDGDQWQFHQWILGAQDYCALACKHPHPLQVNWFDALSAPAFP